MSSIQRIVAERRFPPHNATVQTSQKRAVDPRHTPTNHSAQTAGQQQFPDGYSRNIPRNKN